MTVHDYVRSMELGKEYHVPSNCTVHSLMSYGASRFGFAFRKTSGGNIVRVCPHCGR
jgi:hypothetical protein